MTDQGSVDRRLMLAFEGTTLPSSVATVISQNEIAGITLFRPNNYESPEQLRALVSSIQEASGQDLPLLIAVDQEGGQLHAFGKPATMWPGNMALGAANDSELTRRVAVAIGTELRAIGINVDYAPVADLATNKENPATGTRSFGAASSLVATHVRAFVEGIQSVGVAATMKHFPGKGDSSIDSHLGLPILDHTKSDLIGRELEPFTAAVDAGVRLAMTGHVAIPQITGSDTVPGTVSHEINTDLLRGELAFGGVLITDALDMKALSQGIGQVVDVIAAVRSGVDLLLMTADADQQERVTLGLALAASRQLIPRARLDEADERVTELRKWISAFESPPTSVVGSRNHSDLCLEASERSITLVKDDKALLPLDRGVSVLVIETEPTILTPADTSQYETPYLADEIRTLTTGEVASVVVPFSPTASDITSVVAQVDRFDVVVAATVAAHLEPAQGTLVEELVRAHESVVALSQRTPWDLETYPSVGTYVCAWSANRIPTRAAASALFGRSTISGRLPVEVGTFSMGHGMDLG